MSESAPNVNAVRRPADIATLHPIFERLETCVPVTLPIKSFQRRDFQREHAGTFFP